MLYRSSMKWDIRRLNINPMADVNPAAVLGILCPDVWDYSFSFISVNHLFDAVTWLNVIRAHSMMMVMSVLQDPGEFIWQTSQI